MASPIHMQAAQIGHALSSPVRLRALNLLAQRPWTVGALARELGESSAATSAHLKVLRTACLVRHEKRGRQAWCRVSGPEVLDVLVAAHRAAEALLPEMQAVVREASEDPARLDAVDPRSLAEDAAAGRAVLLDLRPAEEHAAGHLPGARSLPAAEIDELPPEDLPRTGRVLAYCRGPWCVMAREGVARLRDRGVDARMLPLGVVEWQAAGLELERRVPA